MRHLYVRNLSVALLVAMFALGFSGFAVGQDRRDDYRRGQYDEHRRRPPPSSSVHRRWPENDYRRRYPYRYRYEPPHVVYSPPVIYQPPVVYPEPGISFFIPLDIY